MAIHLRILQVTLLFFCVLFVPVTAHCQESNNDNEAQDRDKPVSTARLILNAQEAASQTKYEEAIRFASEVVKREPKDARHHLALANIYFMSAQMKLAVQEYDRTMQLAPPLAPHLWQRGLALYFAQEYELGVRQFEKHQTVNSQDVENAVWHMLCAAKVDGFKKARQELIPINRDTRIPMKEIHKLFAGTVQVDQVIASVVSKEDAKAPPEDLSLNQRSQMYYAYLYVGLYQEMTGKTKEAIASMKKAESVNPLPRNEVMGTVAHVFLKLKSQQANAADKKKQSR